jgi:hypothetical protein
LILFRMIVKVHRIYILEALLIDEKSLIGKTKIAYGTPPCKISGVRPF